MTPKPCAHCIYEGNCETAGLVNRLAVECWLQGMTFECADHRESYFHGIKGVFA